MFSKIFFILLLSNLYSPPSQAFSIAEFKHGAELQKLHNQILELKRNLQNTETEKDNLTEKIKTSYSDTSRLSSIAYKLARENKKIKQQLEEKEQKTQEQEKRLLALTEENYALTDRMTNFNEIQKQLEEMKKKKDNHTILQIELTGIKQTLVDETKKNKTLTEEKQQLQNLLNKANQKISALENHYNNNNSRIYNLYEKIKLLEQELVKYKTLQPNQNTQQLQEKIETEFFLGFTSVNLHIYSLELPHEVQKKIFSVLKKASEEQAKNKSFEILQTLLQSE